MRPLRRPRITAPIVPKPIIIMPQVDISGTFGTIGGGSDANVPVPEKRMLRLDLPIGALNVGLEPEKDREKSLSTTWLKSRKSDV